MSRITIKIAFVERYITTIPKTEKFKHHRKVLKKQITNLKKYEAAGDDSEAAQELKRLILENIGRIELKRTK